MKVLEPVRVRELLVSMLAGSSHDEELNSCLELKQNEASGRAVGREQLVKETNSHASDEFLKCFCAPLTSQFSTFNGAVSISHLTYGSNQLACPPPCDVPSTRMNF